MPETLIINRQQDVAFVTLNRPDLRNAMNHQMVLELQDFYSDIQDNRDIRAVVLSASGKTFCAGGDIKEMQSEGQKTLLSDLDQMLNQINTAPQVTIAKIQGAALGGGLGLVCVSDIAIAGDSARFGLPEVRLGLSPAIISPYVLGRLGITRTRQLMLTGTRFGSEDAKAYGLIHETCLDEALDTKTQQTLEAVLACAPNALAETKKLLFHIQDQRPDQSLDYRATLINRLRHSPEGQEGMKAFIEKRKPDWMPD